MKPRFIETESSEPNFIKTFEWKLLQPEAPVLNEPLFRTFLRNKNKLTVH